MSDEKKFGSVADALAPMADETPSIHRTPKEIRDEGEEGRAVEKKPPAPVEMSQYLLKLRPDQRDELNILAAQNRMTIRGFILHALKQQGLDVTDADIVDRRKKTG